MGVHEVWLFCPRHRAIASIPTTTRRIVIVKVVIIRIIVVIVVILQRCSISV